MRVREEDLPGFVGALMYGADLTFMSVEDAAYNLEQYKLDGLDLPDSITPERLAAEWNKQVKRELASWQARCRARCEEA